MNTRALKGMPMRPITLLLALTLTACSSSCGGTSKPAVNWPPVVTCTEPGQRDLLSSVMAILLAPEDGDSTTIGDRAAEELDRMAQRHGPHVVACLIGEAVRSFEHVPVASVSPAVPAEQPARKRLPTAPSPHVEQPVETLPDSEDTALTAAARGRNFLQRVNTHVQEAPAP